MFDPSCLLSLQKLFNHSDVQTTMTYIGLTEEKNRQLINDHGEFIHNVLAGKGDDIIKNMPIIPLKSTRIQEDCMFDGLLMNYSYLPSLIFTEEPVIAETPRVLGSDIHYQWITRSFSSFQQIATAYFLCGDIWDTVVRGKSPCPHGASA